MKTISTTTLILSLITVLGVQDNLWITIVATLVLAASTAYINHTDSSKKVEL